MLVLARDRHLPTRVHGQIATAGHGHGPTTISRGASAGLGRFPHVWQQGMAHPGSPRAHTSQRNVMMPRVSNAVVTSPQLITTESRRMVRVPPRPQCA
jgi:hypothetical protein